MGNEKFNAPTGYGIIAPSQLGRPSSLLADNINPLTQDFDSITYGSDTIEAQVIIALKTVKKSGAVVQNDGASFTDIKKMDDAVNNRIEGMVQDALQRLINNQDIEYKSTEFTLVDPSNQTIVITVKWINLRAVTSETKSTQIKIK